MLKPASEMRNRALRDESVTEEEKTIERKIESASKRGETELIITNWEFWGTKQGELIVQDLMDEGYEIATNWLYQGIWIRW